MGELRVEEVMSLGTPGRVRATAMTGRVLACAISSGGRWGGGGVLLLELLVLVAAAGHQGPLWERHVFGGQAAGRGGSF